MLARWQPLGGDGRGEINRLHDEMNRLFGRFSNGARELHGTYPPVNVWEDDNNFFVEAELPGFKLDDLEMYVTGDNQLSIEGDRKPLELENGTWHRQERGCGSFSRQMELPGTVDGEKVTAEFKHGVLTITLPKKDEARPRRIEVKAT